MSTEDLPATSNVLLWTSEHISASVANPGQPRDWVETHGGENGGGARRFLCPKNGCFADHKDHRYIAGLEELAGVKAFGGVWSGNNEDENTGGGTSGQQNAFDYISGGPYPRTEHYFFVKTRGYKYLDIFWRMENIAAVEGLSVNMANHATPTDAYYSDQVFCHAIGMPVISENAAHAWANLPVSLLQNRNDSLNSEATVTGTQVPGSTRGPRPMLGFSNFAGGPSSGPPLDSATFEHFLDHQFLGLGEALPVLGWNTLLTGVSTLAERALLRQYSRYGFGWSGLDSACARGLFQAMRIAKWGAVPTSRLYGFLDNGFRIGGRVRIGDHFRGTFNTTTAGFSETGLATIHPDQMVVSHLDGVAFCLGSVALQWGAATESQNPVKTELVSAPVSPATAPRHKMKGRMWARLSN